MQEDDGQDRTGLEAQQGVEMNPIRDVKHESKHGNLCKAAQNGKRHGQPELHSQADIGPVCGQHQQEEGGQDILGHESANEALSVQANPLHGPSLV